MTAKANFTAVKLSDICEFKYGQMPKKENLTSSGFPVFSGYGIVGYSNLHHFTEREIIVVARGEGGTGDVKLSPPMCFLTNLSIVVLANRLKVDKMYLFYHLSSTKLWNLRTGSAQAQITISNLSEHTIKLPPLDIQKKIAVILSVYDDLIESNIRRIAILEEMARLIYREWFVNFRFPGHEKVKLVDSPLGKIPQGWEVKKLGDICSVNNNSVRNLDSFSEIVYLDISSVTKGEVTEMKVISTDEAPGRARRRTNNGDTIWSTVRPNRMSYALILEPPDNLIASTGFAVLSPKNNRIAFTYLSTTNDEYVSYLTSRAKGSAYPAVTGSDFVESNIVVPKQEILDKFESQLQPLLYLVANLRKQSTNLRQTRDLLLPRLISGEIDVSEMEVEGV
jgi:type I restriction enzyme S subunit